MDREPHPSGRDKPDFDDYEKAEPFRKLAKQWGESPASLAHRYALSIQKVSSVILGVKNTKELQECIEASMHSCNSFVFLTPKMTELTFCIERA